MDEVVYTQDGLLADAEALLIVIASYDEQITALQAIDNTEGVPEVDSAKSTSISELETKKTEAETALQEIYAKYDEITGIDGSCAAQLEIRQNNIKIDELEARLLAQEGQVGPWLPGESPAELRAQIDALKLRNIRIEYSVQLAIDKKNYGEASLAYSALDSLKETLDNVRTLDEALDVLTLAKICREIGDKIVSGKYKEKNALPLEGERFWGRTMPALNPTERLLSIMYPIESRMALFAGMEVRDKFFGGTLTGLAEENDAFRHMAWSATLTYMAGAEFAKLWTNAHEYGYPDRFRDDYLETKMDLHNNSVGIEIGNNLPAIPIDLSSGIDYGVHAPFDLFTLFPRIESDVRDALTSGKAVIVSNGQLVPTTGSQPNSASYE